MAKKQTKEEKREAYRLERRHEKIQRFKTVFSERISRVVFTRDASFADTSKGGMALWRIVEDYQRLKSSLERELKGLVETANESLGRLQNNQAAFYSSNGVCARYYEVDKYGHQLDTLRSAIADMARVTGFRVREIEDVWDCDKDDTNALLRVVEETDGKWRIKRGADYLTIQDQVFGGATAQLEYDSEDDAYAALHVIVHGRAIEI